MSLFSEEPDELSSSLTGAPKSTSPLSSGIVPGDVVGRLTTKKENVSLFYFKIVMFSRGIYLNLVSSGLYECGQTIGHCN